ncbi:hypothetical protein BJ742DRAFT_713319, partial [Cladochytrium replicatum]
MDANRDSTGEQDEPRISETVLSSSQTPMAGRRTTITGATAIRANNFMDIVSSIHEKNQHQNSHQVHRQTTQRRKTRAEKNWDTLRAHVNKGFLHSIMNQRETTTNDFLTLVDSLWTEVHRHSALQSDEKDSTTDFITAGWAVIKAAQHAAAHPKVGSSHRSTPVNSSSMRAISSQRRQKRQSVDLDHVTIPSRRESLIPTEPGDESTDNDALKYKNLSPTNVPSSSVPEESPQDASISQGHAVYGLEGLSLDSIPNSKISTLFLKIAEGLNIQSIDEADFYTVQLHFNRAWKLLLLGLLQAESFSRYMAMVSLKRAIPVINETLLDSTTCENLLRILSNLIVSDEKTENRLKAVYLIGHIGFYLGTVREHDHLIVIAFQELATRLLEIQHFEHTQGTKDFDPQRRSLKIYLFHALGKFIRYTHRSYRAMEDMMLYIVYEEFLSGEAKMKETTLLAQKLLKQQVPMNVRSKTAKSLGNFAFGDQNNIRDNVKSSNNEAYHVVLALLGILNNNDLKRSENNQKYVGAIFKPFIHSLMRTSLPTLQIAAVHFISIWMPITNSDAVVLGFRTLISGLEETRTLNFQSFNRNLYEKQHLELSKRLEAEEARLALRGKLLRQLLQIPGSSTKLFPVAEYPSYFSTENSSLMNTIGVVIKMPIHPNSALTVTRPLPSIPGVPAGVTTVPPIFMDSSWADKQTPPQCRYEYIERTGMIPGLAFGYTYSPGILVNVSKESQTQDLSRRTEFADMQKLEADNRQTKGLIRGVNKSPLITHDSHTNRVEALGGRQNTDTELVQLSKHILTVPAGCNSHPSKADILLLENRRIPPGFLTTSPFPSAPSESYTISSEQYSTLNSAIYGKFGKQSTSKNSVALSKKSEIPKIEERDGFTTDKHPILWPSHIPNLKTVRNPTDFPINSPVLFEIHEPGAYQLKQFLAQVNSINLELSAVTVRKEVSNLHREVMSIGTTFNILPLMAIEESVFYLKGKAQQISSVQQRTNEASFACPPLPAGFSPTGDPYYAPPVNLPPFPVGYTTDGIPYFGRSAAVKPAPAGMTIHGVRFYSNESKYTEGTRNIVGGFDNNGQPFYIPRGCTVPHPSGYTSDGIPYYDVPTLMHQRGVMVLNNQKTSSNWKSFEDEESDSFLGAKPEETPTEGVKTRTSNLFAGGTTIEKTKLTLELIAKLECSSQLQSMKIEGEAAANFQESLLERVTRIEQFSKLRKLDSIAGSKYSNADDDLLKDPDDIVAFFRQSEDLAHLKPYNMRINIEPNIIEFQSVQAPLTKNSLLRYRAGRGDHEQRDFFVSVEPMDIFRVSIFHLKLQGEGIIELLVTFNPAAMKGDRVESSLNVIDDCGKKLATCSLKGSRQSFVRVAPLNIDAGWILPDRQKECLCKIENLSGQVVSVYLGLQSEQVYFQNSSASKRPAFKVPQKSIKLQALEQKSVIVCFEPPSLGRFSDVLEISAPGGDLIKANIVGISGIPIAIYPENEENSQAGAALLTRERCEFMKKFKRSDHKGKIGLTDEDRQILKSILAATSDQDSRREAHTLDFGICSDEEVHVVRCLTLMNLSDQPLTVGLYSQCAFLKLPYFVRIAPRMANTVELVLDVQINDTTNPKIRGDLDTVIEIICPEFQNIPLHIIGFVGQPLYFPVWEFVYLRPVQIGCTETIEIFLVNESQYNISLTMDLIPKIQHDFCKSTMLCSISSNVTVPTNIKAHSLLPVQFTFTAAERGPLLCSTKLKILSPKNLIIPAAIYNCDLWIIGMCIEPYQRKPSEILDRNGIDFLRMWMSHPKRIIDEYPTQEEHSQRFHVHTSQSRQSAHVRALDSHVTFFKDCVVFRPTASARTPIGQMAETGSRRSQLQSILVQQKGPSSQQVSFFGSTFFNVDPRTKLFQPGDAENIDLMYVPPSDIHDYIGVYGFGVALVDSDHSFHALQLIAKHSTDFLVFPPPNKEGQVVLDFGKIDIGQSSVCKNTRRITLCNMFTASYSWDIKFIIGKSKLSVFDIDMMFGELESYETNAISIQFRSDAVGIFETIAEISVKETADRQIKPVKIATLLLRGHAVNVSLTGFPDQIDFGSTVVFNRKIKSFTILNNGSLECPVTLLTKPPFTVSPKSFFLQSKTQQEVQLIYNPTESKMSTAKMHIFSNQKLFLIPLSGVGGTAELVCEKYLRKDIDFGVQCEGTISWISLYLTNRGTLPLILKGVSADAPDLVKLQFLSVTSTVPYEGSNVSATKTNTTSLHKDYWGILKRKIKIFTILNDFIRKQTVFRDGPSSKHHTGNPTEEEGSPIPISSIGTFSIDKSSILQNVPQLRPFHSYHLRLGYLNKYQLKRSTAVYFFYIPVTTNEDPESLTLLVKSMSLNVTGHAFRPLEIFPPFYDFGVAPAENFLSYGGKVSNDVPQELKLNESGKRVGAKDTATFFLQIINMSLEAQNVQLQTISTEFTVTGRAWHLLPGEKLEIPVEFHPKQEQIQYHGEAHFLHKHGRKIIRLTGTGASANVVCDDFLNFGSVKIQTRFQKSLKISNRGLLDCRYQMFIIQSETDFYFLGEELYEYEGFIESGKTIMIPVECCCQSVHDYAAHILVKWQRVPSGIWEEVLVQLLITVGMPGFQLQSRELDFRTTFIGMTKSMQLSVKNDGNAVCSWEAFPEISNLSVVPKLGSIDPGQIIALNVEFTPENFEVLNSSLNFKTDAGTKTIACFGIIGVPYLKIPSGQLNFDFGIVAINKTHIRSLNITNNGPRTIKFESSIQGLLTDKVQLKESYEVFFIDPPGGILEPNQNLELFISCVPREYGTHYHSSLSISTFDGEEYKGTLKAIGGQAIIKLGPPSIKECENEIILATAELSKSLPTSRQKIKPISEQESGTALILKAHLANLQEMLSGLRAAETDISRD